MTDACDCIHYEADRDQNEDGDVCHCGHTIEEHAPSSRYPGDRSCKVGPAGGPGQVGWMGGEYDR